MNMIEVDPKLFITCRLCLEETGVYQIVPEVKTKIKYCFDIEVELSYGLPQLICRKCESVLSEYAKVKKNFQEKHYSLMSKHRGHGGEDIIKQQQDTVSSTQQNNVESESHGIIVDNVPKPLAEKIVSNKRSTLDTSFVTSNTELEANTKTTKSPKKQWRKNYMKHFVCRFCSKSLKHKRSIIHHNEQCFWLKKYSNLVKSCSVNIPDIDSQPNLTSSKENVVFNKNKIVNTRNSGNYYVVYSLKLSKKSVSSESSDEDFVAKKKVHKRRRVLSESSNETVIIEENTAKIDRSLNTDDEEMSQGSKKKRKRYSPDESEIECVDLDDSDNASTSTKAAEAISSDIHADKHKSEVNKTVNDIIAMCRAKYLKKFNGRNNLQDSDSFSQRKLLSIGRKVIHKEGFNATGLLRYMEQKDLDVDWIPKLEANVAVKTTLKENKSTQSPEDDGVTWKSVNLSHVKTDFIDMFEKISNSRSLDESELTKTNVPCLGTENMQSQQNIIIKELKSPPLIVSHKPDITSQLFENSSTKYEKKIENNVLYLRAPLEFENQNMSKKLLNANPVANPKQLPKKTPHELMSIVDTNGASTEKIENVTQIPTNVTSVEKNNSECLNVMPIITSTVSLAPTLNNQKNKSNDSNQSAVHTASAIKKPEPSSSSTQPRIKVKNVAELMAEKPIQPKGIAVATSVWSGGCKDSEGINVTARNINQTVATVTSPIYYVMQSNYSQYNNIPQYNANLQLNSNMVEINIPIMQPIGPKPAPMPGKVDYIVMHTAEFPNKRTNSPLEYFKELLQLHNMTLLHGICNINIDMCCIIKFKLVFKQENNPSVTLCLKLFCHNHIFCIRVTDKEFKDLDTNKLSANWQWEILKGFKGDIVNRILENSSRISPEVFQNTKYFMSLLDSIEVTKET